MKKTIFVAFAIEDERQRDFLKGQSLLTDAPFEFIDMSVKEPYDRDWKDRVRTRIKRSDGVIALISVNSLGSEGQAWEIQCANEERRPVIGIRAYKSDYTLPLSMNGNEIYPWSWDTIASFINNV